MLWTRVPACHHLHRTPFPEGVSVCMRGPKYLRCRRIEMMILNHGAVPEIQDGNRHGDNFYGNE